MRDEFIINSNNSALLVIDMTREGLHAYSPEDARQMVNDIEDFINQSGIRPIYCEYVWEEDDSLRNHPHVKKHRAWGLPPFSCTVSKRANSAFSFGYSGNIALPSDLDRILKMNGITNILVAGVEKNLCVWDTALDGVKHGYKVQLVDDLCWSSKWAKNVPKIHDPENYAAKIEMVSKADFIPKNDPLSLDAQSTIVNELDFNS